jgi:hypothetical protein
MVITPITHTAKHGFSATMNAPDQQVLTKLVQSICHRIASFLEREGILMRDEKNCYLSLKESD